MDSTLKNLNNIIEYYLGQDNFVYFQSKYISKEKLVFLRNLQRLNSFLENVKINKKFDQLIDSLKNEQLEKTIILVKNIFFNLKEYNKIDDAHNEIEYYENDISDMLLDILYNKENNFFEKFVNYFKFLNHLHIKMIKKHGLKSSELVESKNYELQKNLEYFMQRKKEFENFKLNIC